MFSQIDPKSAITGSLSGEIKTDGDCCAELVVFVVWLMDKKGVFLPKVVFLALAGFKAFGVCAVLIDAGRVVRCDLHFKGVERLKNRRVCAEKRKKRVKK